MEIKIEESIRKLIQMVLRDRGEQAFNSLTVSLDRSYGEKSLITRLADCGLSNIVVIPKHLLRCHPFLGRSYFKIYRDDDIAEIE